MKKEKTVKTHTRKLKSGKQVTVKQHTASYDAADVVADVLKKKGAGGELEQLKKKKAVKPEPVEKEDIYSEYGFTKDEFAEWYEGTGSKADKKVEKILRKAMGRKAYNELSDSAADNYKKGGANGFFKKSLKAMKETKSSDSSKKGGFDNSKGFKENFPKELHKYLDAGDFCLKKKPTKEVTKAFKAAGFDIKYNPVEGLYEPVDSKTGLLYREDNPTKSAGGSSKKEKTPTEAPAKGKTTSAGADLKVGSSVKMGNSFNLGKGPKESFKVISTFEPNRNDRSTGLTQMAWVERKNGEVTFAYRDESGKWMYDDTWSDTGVTPTYRKHLKDAGYSLGKAKGERGEYYTAKKSPKSSGSKTTYPKKYYSSDEKGRRQAERERAPITDRMLIEKGYKKYKAPGSAGYFYFKSKDGTEKGSYVVIGRFGTAETAIDPQVKKRWKEKISKLMGRKASDSKTPKKPSKKSTDMTPTDAPASQRKSYEGKVASQIKKSGKKRTLSQITSDLAASGKYASDSALRRAAQKIFDNQ